MLPQELLGCLWSKDKSTAGACNLCVYPVPVHHSKPLRKALPRRKVESQLSLGSHKWILEPMSSILCCLWGHCLKTWLITANSVHGLFFQIQVFIYNQPFPCWLSVAYLLERRWFSLVSVLPLKILKNSNLGWNQLIAKLNLLALQFHLKDKRIYMSEFYVWL